MYTDKTTYGQTQKLKKIWVLKEILIYLPPFIKFISFIRSWCKQQSINKNRQGMERSKPTE